MFALNLSQLISPAVIASPTTNLALLPSRDTAIGDVKTVTPGLVAPTQYHD